jgi:hypothetical protein
MACPQGAYAPHLSATCSETDKLLIRPLTRLFQAKHVRTRAQFKVVAPWTFIPSARLVTVRLGAVQNRPGFDMPPITKSSRVLALAKKGIR